MIALVLLAAAVDPLAACAAAVHENPARTQTSCAAVMPGDRLQSALDTPLCAAALAIGRATRDAADRLRMIAEFDRHAVQCRQSPGPKAPVGN